MRTGPIVSATLLAAALAASAHAAVPVVYTNISNLLPNTANQVVQIYVSGTDLIQGENLNFQIDTGGSGPIFTGVDILSGTIFAANNTGVTHPNDPGFNAQGIFTTGTYSGHLACVSTTTSTTAGVTDNGLLATLLISTTATTGSTFVLNMISTPNGGSNFPLGDLGGTTLGLSQPHMQFSIGTATRQWNTNGGGAWNTDANWTPFAPYARGDTANFLGALASGTGVITLDGARVAGTLNFNDTAGSYSLQAGAGGSLLLDNGTQAALIAGLAGTHSIGAPVALTASGANVSVAGGSTLTLGGGVSGSSAPLSVLGAGKMILTGANTYGATNIAAGATLQVGNGTVSGTMGTGAVSNSGLLYLSNTALPVVVPMGGSGTLTIAGNTTLDSISTAATMIITSTGTLQVGDGGTLGLLSGGNVLNGGNLKFNRSDAALHNSTIGGAGTVTQMGTGTTTLATYQGTGPINVNAGKLGFAETSGVRRTSAIEIQASAVAVSNAGSSLDISNHDLVVTGLGTSSYATLQSLVMNGIAGLGLGNGTSSGPQITSSSANNNPNASTFILPYSIDNTFGGGHTGDGSGVGFSDPNYTNGIPVTQPGTALVKYLYYGDLNLDGVVNAADIFQEVGDVGLTTPGMADYGTSYLNGDLLGAGTVTTSDIFLVVGSLGFGSGGSNNGPLGVLDATAALSGGTVSAAPEPATWITTGIAIFSLLISKRRKAIQ